MYLEKNIENRKVASGNTSLARLAAALSLIRKPDQDPQKLDSFVSRQKGHIREIYTFYVSNSSGRVSTFLPLVTCRYRT